MEAQTTKKKGKKRKISKHVLESQKNSKSTSSNGEEGLPVVDAAKPSPVSKKKKQKRVEKSVQEVGNYLVLWNSEQQGAPKGAWKFNKNTQSWLVRHMYEPAKVQKSHFELLLKYLEGLKGDDTRKRIIAEATKRAIRYKNFEKMKENSSSNEDVKKDENEVGAETFEDGLRDLAEWKALDDHDKRKEYKRARKVLETLQ